MQPIITTIVTLFGLVGLPAAIAVGAALYVVHLARDTITEKVKAAIKAEYDERLATFKAQLDLELERQKHALALEGEEQGREAARAQADRTRRLELRLNYYERQIQDFYAPIYNNLQFIWNVWSIANRFEKELSEKDNKMPFEDVKAKIGRTFGVKYYAPLHTAIREILKTKLFLMEGVDMPKSYTDYLTSSVMEGIQRTLKEEYYINTSSVKGVPYPEDFNADVKAGLDKAMRSYDEIIQELAMSAAVAGPRQSPQPTRR